MKRFKLLLLILACLLLAAWLAPVEKREAVRASISMPAAKTLAAVDAPAELTVLGLRPRNRAAGETRLFAGDVPQAVPETPTDVLPVAAPVLQPTAPALPFSVLGRYSDGNARVVFLQHMERNLVVREGDTLLEQYQVLQITDEAVRLRYLPLGEEQRLALDTK